MSHRSELYQQVILEHNRKPRNFQKLDPANHTAEGYNPLCGDHFHVYLNLDPDGTIRDITFDGSGCAISKASASMMTTALKGKTTGDALRLFDEFHNLVLGKLNPERNPHHLGKLAIFAGIWEYPSRVKCATLSWHTMKAALENIHTVTTEKEDQSI